MSGILIGLIVSGVVSPIAAYLAWKKLREERVRLKRFQPVVDVEKEIVRVKYDRDRLMADLKDFNGQVEHARTQLFGARAELAAMEQTNDLHEIGLYKPVFDFKEAAEYKRKIDLLRDHQGSMAKEGLAAVCSSSWTINNSAAEGRKITNKILKLMLRAFNGECDALISSVRYDNVVRYGERMDKSFEAINKLGAGFSCHITESYLKLKHQELSLVHEYQDKVHEEKEEQRRIREEMREEQRRTDELEKLRREAADDEKRYGTLLERAQSEASAAEGDRRQRLLDHVAELETKLRDAQAKAERVKAMAQMTRAGHVYVLSNIGSFGEEVIKIGMTRRLEPQERVDELSDAAVPFCFDVHAMIYSEDAPKLERALHDLFNLNRVNRVNPRKEFFRVHLDQIEEVVRKHHGEFRLTKLAAAVEYRKTLALLAGAPPAGPNASSVPTERGHADGKGN